MSSGQSFGVDLAVPAGGFCFSALSFTGVGGDVDSRGRERSPNRGSAEATSSLSLPSFRTSGDDDDSAGSAGPAPGLSRPRQKASLELLLAEHPRCFGICLVLFQPIRLFPTRLAEVAAAISACGEQQPSAVRARNQIKIDFGRIDRSPRTGGGVSPSATFVSVRMAEPPERGQSRREATRKALICCQEIRVTAEVRPTDAPRGPWIGRQLTTGVDPCSRKAHALQDNVSTSVGQ